LDTIFEDPKEVIVETNLAFSHNTYCVKIKLATSLFIRYLSNMQVAWLHIINLASSSKTCISSFFNKIENKLDTSCGNIWLPPNPCLTSLPFVRLLLNHDIAKI
jgi:hypothetical protein